MTEAAGKTLPSRCDVCLGELAAPGQRRCSEACREFARSHKRVHAADLPAAWEKHRRKEAEARKREEGEAAARVRPCPSGKVRHHKKRDAETARRKAVRERYRACPDWLRVYQCDLCRGGWHLTSNPARAGNLVSGQGGER